jgi:hypothetical protein
MQIREAGRNPAGSVSAAGQYDMAALATYARYLVTTAWVVSGGWLAGATAGEVRKVLVVVTTPPEVIKDVVIRNVADEKGRKASFRILLFSDEFRWRINSFDSLEDAGRRPQFTPEMKAVLNSATEIICVGASSEEVPTGVPYPQGRVQEEHRAARRAEKIAVWVREALTRPIPVRKLNVGHHAPTGMDDTSAQRRLVIILVLDQERDANIDQSLRSAMAGEAVRAPIFEALLTRYSLGGRESFTWVP